MCCMQFRQYLPSRKTNIDANKAIMKKWQVQKEKAKIPVIVMGREIILEIYESKRDYVKN